MVQLVFLERVSFKFDTVLWLYPAFGHGIVSFFFLTPEHGIVLTLLNSYIYKLKLSACALPRNKRNIVIK